MPRPRARLRILKKLPHASGRNRAREGGRPRQDRNLVLRRGSYWPEEQDHPPVGNARYPPERSSRPAYCLHLHLRRGLPERGQGRAALILPACNTEATNLHLAEIAAIVAPGAHAVFLVDQAGWHLSMRLIAPPNITNIALPPKCPELNPVENVWQFMRNNWLSNRVFKSYDDLVDHCCEAWNKLVDQPWRIMSIGLRQWAHGF
jgi:transposase